MYLCSRKHKKNTNPIFKLNNKIMMKKYLMMGIAALALASCSKDDITYVNPDEAKYEMVFVNRFGTPNPNHTWGFGSSTRALTRANVNVNGNMWETTPEVTAAEAAAVYAYVNRLKTDIPHYSETAPNNLQNYYVTQVWGGQSSDDNCVYSNYDNTVSGTLGSAHMNHLNIAQSGTISIDKDGNLIGDWVHINNFNAGDNRNFGGNTLITDGGTLDFAYHCTEDNKYHNKWIIIDGQYVIDSEGNNYAGKYYVCFDFVSWTNDVYTNASCRDANGNPITGIHIDGAYTNVQDAIDANAYVTYWFWNGTANEEVNTTMGALNNAGCYEWNLSNINQSNMYYQANEYYTDWIVRLVEAQPKDQPSGYDYRVMAEDLSTNEKSDFDFNDVVFDVKYVSSTIAKVKVRAAGGVYPIRIAGNDNYEVHALLGGGMTMLNTYAGHHNDLTAQVIEVSGSFGSSAEDAQFKAGVGAIKIEVSKDGSKTWTELTAPTGKAASKIGVPVDVDWCDEFQDIDEKWGAGAFAAWVGNETNKFWTSKTEWKQ